MNCTKCGKKTTIETKISGKNYCKKHFEEIMEKRIRKYLRTQKKINTKKTYYIESETKENKTLLEIYLKNIFNGRLKLNNANIKTPQNQIISTKTANESAEEFLETFFKNKKDQEDKKIKPFTHITDTELTELKKIHKIKPAKNMKKNTLLNKLEEKYPGTVLSTIKSKEFLKNKKIKK